MNEQLTPKEREMLEQSGRECFGSLTASMSHELNNVISIIDQNIGLLNDLLSAGNDPVVIERSRFEKVLTRLAAQAERGSALVKLLNTFAHSVDADGRGVNLADVASLSQSLWKRIAEMRRVEIKNFPAQGLAEFPDLPYKAIWALFLALRTATEKCPSGSTIIVKINKTAEGSVIIVETPMEKDVDIAASTELVNLMNCLRGDLRIRQETGYLIQELHFYRRE